MWVWKPHFALGGVFVDLVCHRCHMEEPEQQAAGLSALADQSPVVSLGTMPAQVGIAHNQLFSPLYLELMKQKKLFLWGTPCPRSLHVKPSLLCTTQGERSH